MDPLVPALDTLIAAAKRMREFVGDPMNMPPFDCPGRDAWDAGMDFDHALAAYEAAPDREALP